MSDRRLDNTDARAARVGELLNDFFDRQARGEAVSEAELLSAHPDIADELRAGLGVLGDIGAAPCRIDALIRQRVLSRCSDPGDDSRYRAQLGQYQIIREIGQGGMGLVLKARDPAIDRFVAIKLLRTEFASDPSSRKRFTREARAAATLKHPNVVAIHTVGESSGVPHIVMEYVAGPSLAEMISSVGRPSEPEAQARVRPSEPEAQARTQSEPAAQARDSSPTLDTATIREIFRQLLSALAAAHDAGLIHRDIKSSNILLEQFDAPVQPVSPEPQTLNPEPSFTVKLADFGLARLLASQTRVTAANLILGTPEYMSPEQARGDADVDHRTDLYSAGVVLYEMLTGRVPFKADTPTAVLHQITHIDPPNPRTINKDVDPALASLALRLMAKERGERLASANEALAKLRTGKPVVNRTQWRNKRRVVASMIVAPLLVAGSLTTWGLIGKDPVISDLRVDADTQQSIQVRYGSDIQWRTFHRFPTQLANQSDQRTVVLARDAEGEQVVVAGLPRELAPGSGDVLVAMRSTGAELWRATLHSDLSWPDCAEPRAFWPVSVVHRGEFDGAPGDELIVVAQDPQEYPTRISLMDPGNGAIRASFWHFGHIGRMLTLPRYFSDGRPAILAWGLNNKLDGFEDDPRGSETQHAHWNLVSVIMILDPLNLEGLGPPFTDRLPTLSPVTPVAYAFLDRPPGAEVMAVPGPTRNKENSHVPLPEELWRISKAVLLEDVPSDGSGPWLRVELEGRLDTEASRPTLTLTVDRNLELRSSAFPNPTGRTKGVADSKLSQFWRVIIRDGRRLQE